MNNEPPVHYMLRFTCKCKLHVNDASLTQFLQLNSVNQNIMRNICKLYLNKTKILKQRYIKMIPILKGNIENTQLSTLEPKFNRGVIF